MSTTTAPVPPRAPTERKDSGFLGLVRRRPILAFIVLANAMSWIAWLPYILSNHGLGVWDFSFPGGTGGGQLLGMLPGAYLGPIGSALFITIVTEGRAGVCAWIGRLWRWNVSWRWYAGILLGVPLVTSLAAWALNPGDSYLPTMAVLVALVPNLLVQLVTTGLAEEPGWRDFLLPRAQRAAGPFRAAIGVGVVWGVWHFPLYLTEWGGWPDFTWLRPLGLVAFCIALNVVMTWVFNRTGQSLPMAMLLHVSINNTASVAFGEMFPELSYDRALLGFVIASTIGAIIVGVATRGRLGYEPEVLPADDGARLAPVRVA